MRKEEGMNNTMFGVIICHCDEDLQEREIIDGIVFDANCHGVIALEVAGND